VKQLLGLIGFVCFAAAIPSIGNAGSIWGLGAGSKRCETWLTAAEDLETVCGSWILGFWSGLNAGAPTESLRNDGRPTDNMGILELVKGECRIHPGETLWNATAKTRDREAAKTQ